ncbi:MAG: 23S rRNA (uracil(1939)-C(5))-methyltransferase RlmD [Acetivibrionales bacterium]
MPMVVKNRDYVVDITDMTHEGLGVGRIDGLAVFTDGALAGEQVELKIIKVRRTYAVGKLLKVLKPSPDRVIPFCSVFKRCGGCSLQHMDYNAQLAFKTKLVRDSLERIGGLDDVKVRDTIGMKSPYNYRNKAQYPVASADGRIVTGFYAPRSHEVIGSEECRIQDAESDRIRKLVTGFMMEKGIPAYDEKTGKGLVRHIITRVGFNTGEIMVILVINGDTLPHVDELVKRLVDGTGSKGTAFQNSGSSRVKSVYLNVNTANTNVIMGDKNILVYGSESIAEKIGDYTFMISPGSFFQVNTAQTEVLYSKVLEFAGLNGSETVFDLYCGIGTISLFLSSRARMVYGVEVVTAAVNDARKNAELNGAGNVEFIEGEAEKAVPELYRKGINADVVVLDPPRKGCDESLLRLIAADMRPDRIVYVSCNPATLACDLKYLDAQGYRAAEVQPVDLFPWTGHVECVVLITKL